MPDATCILTSAASSTARRILRRKLSSCCKKRAMWQQWWQQWWQHILGEHQGAGDARLMGGGARVALRKSFFFNARLSAPLRCCCAAHVACFACSGLHCSCPCAQCAHRLRGTADDASCWGCHCSLLRIPAACARCRGWRVSPSRVNPIIIPSPNPHVTCCRNIHEYAVRGVVTRVTVDEVSGTVVGVAFVR